MNDVKFVCIGGDIAFGQLELWDGNEFIENNIEKIYEIMNRIDIPDWLMLVPSISEENSYICTNSKRIRDFLLVKLDFKEVPTKRNHSKKYFDSKTLYLRKDILLKMYKDLEMPAINY
jgi:hypothetical protein